MRTLALAAAAFLLAAPAQALESALLAGVPHVRQQPDFCGEACAESWMRKLGHTVTQDQIFELGEVDPALGRGLYTDELARALRKLGFEVGPVWTKVEASQGSRRVEEQFEALVADLARGIPSIVCGHYDDSPRTTEHFRLVLGYDGASDEVVYHEPAEDEGAYRRMPRELFLKLWPFKHPKHWSLIRLRLDGPGKRPELPKAQVSRAELARHVMALKARLPGAGYTVAVEGPFVIIGDEAPAKVRERAARTVRWTAEKLRAQYFEKDPDGVLDIWILKDLDSFRRHAWTLFGDRPDTPYGYYSSQHSALIMNIGPGAGTLVHELVHPFVRANFPGCPAWLNEGLASLYERPGEEGGKIRGYPNWRLPGLQRAIRADDLITLPALMALAESDFYDDPSGEHYAQARYLCYWLQEQGLLEEFVRRFRASAREDPTGVRTLAAVIGTEDLDEFEARWRKFVMGLRHR